MVEPIKANACRTETPVEEKALSPLACYDPKTPVTVPPLVDESKDQNFSLAKKSLGLSFILAGCSPYYEEELCAAPPNEEGILKKMDLSDLKSLPEAAKNRLIKILESIPSHYLSAIKRVEIKEAFESAQGFQGYGSRKLNNAAMKLPGGVIAVRRADVESDDLKTLYQLRNSVIHEVGHLAAERLSVASRHDWAELHRESRVAESFPTTYAGTSAVESFAEFFEVFFTQPSIIYMGAVQDPTFRKKYNFFAEHVFCFDERVQDGFEFFSILLDKKIEDKAKEGLYRSRMEQVAFFSLYPEMQYEIAKIKRKDSLRTVNVEEALTWFAKSLEHKPRFNLIPGEDYDQLSDHGIYEYRFTPALDFLDLFEEQITDPQLAGQLALFLKYYVNRLEAEDPDLPYLYFRSHAVSALINTMNFFTTEAPLWENQKIGEDGIRETIDLAKQFGRLWKQMPSPLRKKYLIDYSEHLLGWTANMVREGDTKVAETFLEPLLIEWDSLVTNTKTADIRSILQIRLGAIAGWLAQGKIKDLWKENTPEMETAALSYLKLAMKHLTHSANQTDIIENALRQATSYFIAHSVSSQTGVISAIPPQLAPWIDDYFAKNPTRLRLGNSQWDRLQTEALLAHALSDPPGTPFPESYTIFKEEDGTQSISSVGFGLVDFSSLVSHAVSEEKGEALEVANTHLHLLGDLPNSPLFQPSRYLAYSQLGRIFLQERLAAETSVQKLYCEQEGENCQLALQKESIAIFLGAYRLFYGVPLEERLESTAGIRDNIIIQMDNFLGEVFASNPFDQSLLWSLNDIFENLVRSGTIPTVNLPFLFLYWGRIEATLGNESTACSIWREGENLGVFNSDRASILNVMSEHGC